MLKPALQSIHLYPVKSIAGSGPGEAVVEPWGLAGDRRWLLVDAERRQITQRQQPTLALAHAEGLPGGGLRLTAPGREPLTVEVPEYTGTLPVEVWRDVVEAVPAGAAAAEWFSAYLGVECRLMYLDLPEKRRPVDPKYSAPGDTVSFADGFPLLLTTTSSLDALNSLIAQGDHADEGPLPMNRFRPNVVVDGTAPWAEDDWRRVRIGEVEFQVVKPCSRCVVTTTDQLTAERGKEPLRTLARHRRFGDRLVFGQNLIPRGVGTIRIGDPFEILD
ncbi:molybdenum cofactor biosynthesis protein [Streptomyces nigrescens]|uniref:Molybdenum cofactor biosynthesis protein n=2 Tax=Streptomyces TaxID=1883 RepID=A0ABN6QW91_STRNI|nr:MOSC N-terminal beta barrel domain-containing protein [Streptomyces nigrescens]MEE4419851.1 MOSC N-terminal beta barrel domain-containing protein [Streptomyces sp. DSM 41528]BDM68719.1 molybdenum cofactor biosynthesis protein [Streptomyces nigrescens]